MLKPTGRRIFMKKFTVLFVACLAWVMVLGINPAAMAAPLPTGTLKDSFV